MVISRTEPPDRGDVIANMLTLGVLLGVVAIRSIATYHIDKPGSGFDVRITYPEGQGPFPVIVWSHGLGGSKDAYQPLAIHWAEHGYVVIQPTHADSLEKRLGGMTGARAKLAEAMSQRSTMAAMANWDERPRQISAVIDALSDLEKRLPELKGKLDTHRIAVGGHSFGAHTSQLVAGTSVVGLRYHGAAFEDKRPIAFMWISPQGTGTMLTKDAWKGITRPVLMISGDNDKSPVGGQPPSWRKEVWDGLAPGDKYLLWVKDAYHGFGGITGHIPFPGSGPQIPGQVEDVKMATTAFLDAYVKGDIRAKASLNAGLGPFPAPAKLTHK